MNLKLFQKAIETQEAVPKVKYRNYYSTYWKGKTDIYSYKTIIGIVDYNTKTYMVNPRHYSQTTDRHKKYFLKAMETLKFTQKEWS